MGDASFEAGILGVFLIHVDRAVVSAQPSKALNVVLSNEPLHAGDSADCKFYHSDPSPTILIFIAVQQCC